MLYAPRGRIRSPQINQRRPKRRVAPTYRIRYYLFLHSELQRTHFRAQHKSTVPSQALTGYYHTDRPAIDFSLYLLLQTIDGADLCRMKRGLSVTPSSDTDRVNSIPRSGSHRTCSSTLRSHNFHFSFPRIITSATTKPKVQTIP